MLNAVEKNYLRFGQRVLFIFFCISLFYPLKLFSREIVVVVSSKSSIQKMDKATVRRIFLGKKKQLNGVSLIVYETKKPRDLQEKFYKQITGYSLSKLRRYWAKKIFTGRGTPPKTLPNGVSVKRKIANNLNAIGFVDRSLVDEKLKVVFEIRGL